MAHPNRLNSAALDLIPNTATADELKAAMRQLAAGISVLTTGTGDARTGATVTSATALSVEPPTIIVNINLTASVWPTINAERRFCLNILSSEQQSVADRFAGRNGEKGAARYEGAEWYALASGALALKGALASIDCEVEEIIERHTHAIIIGRALKIVSGNGEPLIYHHGHYHTLTR
ncbi:MULTISPECIES: flavin reductase family protein [Brucella/Ochrobactrum group]|jgi:flavin reductase (DIM6/NTAB) family NADH-FMN oxidoreductase RutF|uniref:flavin reductase family protein n=1 Tax=Brucella/Ochrobactrum group TaxID=2826938 RepID=UPI001C0463EC|nr:flavin reductase family protein [Brucella sp. NBRC 12950]QWK79569.1 flavin reductase family protein [Ochrobactrum sp. BTU1]GLU26129.1 flavin reductase [Brucella sp. NBRC 12950]